MKTSADETYKLLANPERYGTFACTLGSEGFESGTHGWTVEVEANTSWEVGVSSGISQRKVEDIWMGVLECRVVGQGVLLYNLSPWQQEKTSLQVTKKLQRIGAAGL